jgi:hypothetical protein
MSEIHDDLNAVSADLAADADRLKAIELEKQSLTPGNERIAELSAEADELLRRMTLKGRSEYDLALAAEAEAAGS